MSNRQEGARRSGRSRSFPSTTRSLEAVEPRSRPAGEGRVETNRCAIGIEDVARVLVSCSEPAPDQNFLGLAEGAKRPPHPHTAQQQSEAENLLQPGTATLRRFRDRAQCPPLASFHQKNGRADSVSLAWSGTGHACPKQRGSDFRMHWHAPTGLRPSRGVPLPDREVGSDRFWRRRDDGSTAFDLAAGTRRDGHSQVQDAEDGGSETRLSTS